jgi:hypothetical protein
MENKILDIYSSHLIRVSSGNITALNENEIFVFGSNIQGNHIGGAAKIALENFGAIQTVNFGLMNRCFAIPTIDLSDKNKASLKDIEVFVEKFIEFSKQTTGLDYLVTEIGCGIAGFTPEQIAPLFKDCIFQSNIYLPKSFNMIIHNIFRNELYKN